MDNYLVFSSFRTYNSYYSLVFTIMVQISEVKGNNARDNRTATHTHIKGLGLRLDGIAEKQAAGFVGQAAAREVSIDLLLATESSD